ncbi:hypothetical protein BBJ28_00020748 [Nothophytophthora sp. Chile5]|nr:hypothetical protein BBJ28_00020748 [Nothophytophthora sp. Chile5]
MDLQTSLLNPPTVRTLHAILCSSPPSLCLFTNSLIPRLDQEVENTQQAAQDPSTCFLSQPTGDMTEEKPTQPKRWDATWGEAATRDRIGDHTAARYRHFRRYIDEHDESVDANLFAELVSVEELRRELQPYEDAGPFLRLALTGDLVEKLQHLNGVLDSAFAGGGVDLPERLRSWQWQLGREREQRTEMYDVLLQHETRREEALPVEWEDQLELLAMLKAGFETYAKYSKLKEYPLTDAEEQLVSAAYDLLVSRSDIVIPPLPVWFWASTDASNESKLTRLGLSSSRPKSGTSEEVMETASQWWELHHPHIVRFMGAYHVGQSPYFVHERTRPLALYLGSNGKTRGEVWKRLLEAARGVEYLHRRGFVHKHLMPADFLCAEFEAKTLLSGMGLVACRSERSASAPALANIHGACNTSGRIPECLVVEDERPSVVSDIYALGQCVFAFLGFSATSADLGSADSVVQCQDLPSHCPEYLDASEWDLIQKMCAADLNDRVNMTYVLEKMQETAYPVVDEEDATRSMMENLDEQELPGWSGYTVREFLFKFNEFSSEPGEPTRKAFTRLLQLHEMMKEAVPSPEPMVVNKYLSLLSRIMNAMDKRKSFSASVHATGSRFIDQTALTFSAEIDRVFRLLNVHEGLRVDSAPAFEKNYFDKVLSMARSRIETSVAACDGSADSSETQSSDEDRRELEALQQHLDRQTGERRDQGNTRASTLPRWFVPQFEVETGAFIAAGGFGSVYRGQWYGTEVVVKEIILKKEDTPQQKRADFLREANTWFQLNHRNVVKMYGGCHVGRLVFVCEYASQGSLDSFSKAEGRDPLLIWSTLLSTATGLRYLHDVGVVHGDLKGNNILIGKDGVAKLTDFGLSFFRKNADLEAEQGALGAYRWKSPECLNGRVATFASDIFSFGMCIIEAVSGALPWGNRIDDIAVKHYVTKGELPNRPAVFEDEEWDLSGVASHQNAARYAMQTFSALTQGNVLTEQEVLQVVKLFHSGDAKQDWAAIALGYVNCPCSAIRADVTSRLVGLIERESVGLLKAEAVRAIGYLASDDTSRTLIVSHGAIPSLLEMMSAGSDAEQSEAARTLGCLAIGCESNQDAIADAGAIKALVSLIRRGTYQQRIEGALALRRLAEGNADIEWIVRSTCWDASNGVWDNATHIDPRRMLEEIARMRGGDEWKDKGTFPALVDLMLYGDDQQKNEAQTVLYARGHDRKNDRVKFSGDPVATLIEFVRVGTAEEKLESAKALHSLADDSYANRFSIVREGGIVPLVALVRDGTNSQKLMAAELLGLLAAINDANRIAIARKGGITPLVTLVREGMDSQKEKAAKALGHLAVGNNTNGITIAREGGIAPLVTLVQDGTDLQKLYGADALGRLSAGNDATGIAIVEKGGIAPLVALAGDGKPDQRENALNALSSLVRWNGLAEANAVEALGRLADGNDATGIAIVEKGGIAPLVALAGDGKPDQREYALAALASLASLNDESLHAICAPLVVLVRDGTDWQKANAAEALGRLAAGNDANGIAIVQEGGIAPLVALVQNGVFNPRWYPVGALASLVRLNDESVHAICAPLVALVRDGTNWQKANAAEALGRLAAVNDATGIAIVQEGGITPLKENAAEALNHLADGNNATQLAIVREGGIDPLVALAVDRAFPWEKSSLKALASLVSLNDEIVHAICTPLVALVRDGTDSQKANAAEALGRLADGNDATQTVIAREGGITPLMALVRDGTDSQKLLAAEALGRLAAGNDATRIAIAQEGWTP